MSGRLVGLVTDPRSQTTQGVAAASAVMMVLDRHAHPGQRTTSTPRPPTRPPPLAPRSARRPAPRGRASGPPARPAFSPARHFRRRPGIKQRRQRRPHPAAHMHRQRRRRIPGTALHQAFIDRVAQRHMVSCRPRTARTLGHATRSKCQATSPAATTPLRRAMAPSCLEQHVPSQAPSRLKRDNFYRPTHCNRLHLSSCDSDLSCLSCLSRLKQDGKQDTPETREVS